VNGFHYSLFPVNYQDRFSRVDLAFEYRAVLHDDTAAGNIACNLGALGERDHAFAVNVSDEMPENDDGTGMDIGLDPALLAYRQMFFVMRDRALDVTFDNQVFICRQLTLEHQGWAYD